MGILSVGEKDMKHFTTIATTLMLTCSSVLFAAEETSTIPSKAAILEHPVHPMLVVFPLGLFLTALLFDFMYVWKKEVFWKRAAFYTMFLGFAGGLAAAIPGMIDYFYAIPHAAESYDTATIHAVLNGVVLLLFGVNLFIRYKFWDYGADARGRALLRLSAAGVLLMLYAASLGGHMVYAEGVGVKLEEEATQESETSSPKYLHFSNPDPQKHELH